MHKSIAVVDNGHRLQENYLQTDPVKEIFLPHLSTLENTVALSSNGLYFRLRCLILNFKVL
jgi:hypothetical protein